MADDLADDRWTVRGVPKAYKEKAVEAAGRRKVTLGAWVCSAVDLALQAEREPLDLTPPKMADKTSDMADARLTPEIITQAGPMPRWLRSRVHRMLGEALGVAPPPPPKHLPRVTRQTPQLLNLPPEAAE